MEGLAGTTVLVSGGAGFVGSNLVVELLAAGVDRVTIVDNLLSSTRANLSSDHRVYFIEGSIADDQVLAALEDELDYLFHLATFHGNQSSIFDPLADHENNLLTTLKLFERTKGFSRLRRVVYAGAGCAVAEKTFGEAAATTEDAPISLQMDSPYSISKLVGEFYAVYYHSRHALPVVRARFQNVYGPREILGAGRWRGTPATVWRNVVPSFIYRAIHGQPLPVEGSGEATRDFIFVGDLVRGLLCCALRGQAGEVYNLASGAEVPILELAEEINRSVGNRAGIERLPARTWDHSGRRFGCPEKSRRELGFEARIQLAEGLERTVAWTRDSLDLIESCIEQHAAHMASG